MSNLASVALSHLCHAIADVKTGLNSELQQAAMSTGAEVTPISPGQLRTTNLAADIAERAGVVVYPSVHMYCDRLINSLEEKFRSFSGTAQFTVEVRTTHDHADALSAATHAYVDALIGVVQRMRGRWSQGIFYGGMYEVTFGPIRRGGKNYIQAAKVQLQVNISL